MKEYTVKEVADILGKHEETIKRWIRSGKFPNSYRNSDKEGWRIVESDLLELINVVPTENFCAFSFTHDSERLIH